MRGHFLRAASPKGGGGGGDLLLDVYGGAAAAYSLRQLRTGVGNVVRVRRSNDNTESDFAASDVSGGGLAAWVGGGNNGFISTWYDQSGNGLDLTATNRPRIVNNGILETDGGQPAIRFIASSSTYLERNPSPLASSSRQSYFVVGNCLPDTDTWESLFVDSSPDMSSFWAVRRESALSWLKCDSFPSGWGDGGGGWADSGRVLVCAGGGIPMTINGGPVLFNSNGPVNTASSELILNVGSLLGASSYLGGYVQELILYSSDRSSTRVAQVADINSYYSIY